MKYKHFKQSLLFKVGSYMVLRTVSDGFKVSEFHEVLKLLGLMKFAGAMMYVLKEVFDLEEQYMICVPNENEG